jgi:crotonobetainyl-CoA:carnitine CoA-transferase CaiB-like acyl-CoA transferase
MERTSTPLAGLRVVEQAGWAGAFAGRLLADGGADVVRVAPPGGDALEQEPPFFGESGVSIQAAWYNAGKRIVALDLGSEEGRELLAGADLLIEDWRGDDAPFDGDKLREAFPGLVRLSVTPMGREGPWAGLAVNDLVATALCGAASITGTPETPPLTGYGNQTAHTVGLYAACCALAGVRLRDSSGKGCHIDLSSHETLTANTEQMLMQWFWPEGGRWTTPVAQRMGSLHWSGGYEVYPDREGNGLMVTPSLGLIDKLIPWLEETDSAGNLTDREEFPDLISLVKQMPHVMSVLREWTAKNAADDLFMEAQRRRLPFGAVWPVSKAVATPQIEARGYFSEREVDGFGSVPFPGRLLTTEADGPAPGPPARVEEVAWSARTDLEAISGEPSAERPLAGLRVLDFTHVLAGPFGTRVLADLGADVIKVGTAARNAGANTLNHPYYLSWNRNKRNLSLDMRREEARDLARRLAGQCDAIIDNFSAGVLARWGLSREGLSETAPGVTVVAMGGMGNSGPWRDFVTFAPTIHAITGLTYLTNVPGRRDIGFGYSLTDHLSGVAAALGILEGVEHRRRTGQGLDVDVAQYELGLGLMGPALLDHLANGRDPEPVANRHPFDAWAPHGIYPTQGEDRWVALAVRGDDQWRAFCEVMGAPELADDPRFGTHEARVANQDALDKCVSTWTAGQDRYQVMEWCQARGVAAGAVQDGADIATADPHLAARAFIGTIPTEDGGEQGAERFPALVDGRRPTTGYAARSLGADTFDVLTELLGMPPEEIGQLVADGVLS